jgi:hypothetical protein
LARRDSRHGFSGEYFARDVAEAALAHLVGDKAEQAYRRGSAFDKRRRLMDAWARYCVGEPKDKWSRSRRRHDGRQMLADFLSGEVEARKVAALKRGKRR